jgi:TonB family protein
MVLVSAALHITAVALVVAIPYSLRNQEPKLVSYSVDLVAPDRLGGTNIPAAVKVPPKPEAPAPPPPPAAAVNAPEPPPVEKKKEVAPPPPPKEEAKPKDKPKEKPPVKVSAKKEEKPKAPPKEQAKPEAKAKKAEAKPAPAKKEEANSEAAAKEARDAIAARLREERIAAAVKRAQSEVKEQEAVGNGAGTGAGPAAIGPGEGIGGTLKGIEWIMYKNRVETMIRENWVWTGANHALETVVTFGIAENGDIVDFQVQKPSGDPTYDASIERAIKGVSPLPPPPEAYRNEFSQYELTFNAEFLQM